MLIMKKNSILFFQAAKNSSSHRMSDILEYERNKKKKDSPQTDTKGKGAKLMDQQENARYYRKVYQL